jgi:hypothetical protein
MVRGKFSLNSITETAWPGKTLKFSAVYDDGIPENQRYATATPSGSVEMHVTNEAALNQFKLGKSYYLDFTEVE